MKEPWSIKSRARQCAGTEEPFEDGEQIHAAIFPDPDSSGYVRKDFSDEAWKNREEESEVPFSHWKTVFKLPVAEEKTEDVVQDDPETLLRRLVEEEEEHTENARYILAVMLERQKLLRETDTQELPTGILRVYEHRKTGDVFIIKDPQIALSDVERVQDEIRELLDPQPIEEPEETPENAEEEGETKDESEGASEPEEGTSPDEESAVEPSEEQDEENPDSSEEEEEDDEEK
ncbi:hypothetical protein N9Z02_02375 [Akkermansiaceae bacterium]|nr:hypothetical protein [Akkermansiaceae bacterium]